MNAAYICIEPSCRIRLVFFFYLFFFLFFTKCLVEIILSHYKVSKNKIFPCEWLRNRNPLWFNCRGIYTHGRMHMCRNLLKRNNRHYIAVHPSVKNYISKRINRLERYWWQIHGTYYRCYYWYYSNTWSVFTIIFIQDIRDLPWMRMKPWMEFISFLLYLHKDFWILLTSIQRYTG